MLLSLYILIPWGDDMNFLSMITKTELTNLERENDHVHPILPSEK